MSRTNDTQPASDEVPLTLLFDPKAALYAERLRDEVPSASLLEAPDVETAMREAPRATSLVALAHNVTSQLIERMPRLRWIQALTTGIDPLLKIANLPPDVTITTARGVSGPQMAELAFMMMLALVRDLPRMLKNQAAQRWERWPQPTLHGRTIVIVGVGSIAEEFAMRCGAFGMRVIGISASRTEAPHFDLVLPRTALTDVIAAADFVVVLVPAAADTQRIIGKDVLANIKPGAVLINLARGQCVDHDALLTAIQSGRLAGAGLDVFDAEPLDAASPLWAEPRILITPHIGGFSDRYVAQVTPLIAHNLLAFLGNTPSQMRNVANRVPAVH